MVKKLYILVTDHHFPFNLFDKTWIMYYPGYKGIYALSTDGHILSLERKIWQSDGRLYPVKLKLLKPLTKTSKTGYSTKAFNLYSPTSNGKPKTVTINQTLKIAGEHYGV